MNWLEPILVALILLGATCYLAKVFWPKSKSGGCACGSTDCKAPKPKLRH